MRAQAKQEMIMRHMPLVAFVVGRMSTDNQKTLGLDREDALAYGIEGLIQSVDAFDEERGTSFASFAVRRIRGSILDAIRDEPASAIGAQERTGSGGSFPGIVCESGALADAQGDRLPDGDLTDQLHDIQRHSSSKFISLEHALQDRGGDSAPAFDPVDEDELADPAKAADHSASLALLDDALHCLNARDRAILRLRYNEAKPFHEIGTLMGLSESRVCQLHKRILSTLKRQINLQLEDVAAA